jgi:hypothetical protein
VIYGLNFGGPDIPDIPRSAFRKFKKRIVIPGETPRTIGTLVGIGQDAAERDEMVLVATNGHRQLYVLPVQTAGGTWYGIYAY